MESSLPVLVHGELAWGRNRLTTSPVLEDPVLVSALAIVASCAHAHIPNIYTHTHTYKDRQTYIYTCHTYMYIYTRNFTTAVNSL